MVQLARQVGTGRFHCLLRAEHVLLISVCGCLQECSSVDAFIKLLLLLAVRLGGEVTRQWRGCGGSVSG